MALHLIYYKSRSSFYNLNYTKMNWPLTIVIAILVFAILIIFIMRNFKEGKEYTEKSQNDFSRDRKKKEYYN